MCSRKTLIRALVAAAALAGGSAGAAQAAGPITIVQQLVALARANKVPVVGVTELVPPGMTFQRWMLSEINDTEKALAGPNS